MANLYYGRGECFLEGHIISLKINYEGEIMVDSFLPLGYTIQLKKGRIIIKPFLEPTELATLFSYTGRFKIKRVIATDYNNANVPITINRNMDFTNLLTSTTGSLTRKTKDMKSGYNYKRFFRETKIMPIIYDRLHTGDTEKILYLKDTIYKGFYHLHIDGTIMTGRLHDEKSQILEAEKSAKFTSIPIKGGY